LRRPDGAESDSTRFPDQSAPQAAAG